MLVKCLRSRLWAHLWRGQDRCHLPYPPVSSAVLSPHATGRDSRGSILSSRETVCTYRTRLKLWPVTDRQEVESRKVFKIPREGDLATNMPWKTCAQS